MVNGTFDKMGIHITTNYRGQPVHYLILATSEFIQWQLLRPIQRTELIMSRINPSSFEHNQNVIDLVINATISTINRLLPLAQRDMALRFTLPKH